ncbi:nucleoside hydrolase [Kineococcus sp. SYSU DK003]|uniref:nucleoside hydrolase n=1 Tax=Kineococcus sp. SYSU DK003 TaxID=3383124 RepID=UPI003D7E0535
MRVVSDNDYAGDPDGLLQLAHHALSPSVDLVTVVSSHLRPGDPFDDSGASAAHGAQAARRVLDLAGRPDVPVVAGTEQQLADRRTPIRSAGAEAIVAEAVREDVDTPLFVVLGAGLTELASAWLIEPGISRRLTAVWIGGPEHPGVPAPPGTDEPSEYNLRIDVTAAQVVFNDSDIPLWQVPRDSYRQLLASMTELQQRIGTRGELGAHLFAELDRIADVCGQFGLSTGETYVLGDTPLVLLTALQSSFEADPASSSYRTLPCPELDDRGEYVPGPGGRPIRVYDRLDTRLALEDLYAKLARF